MKTDKNKQAKTFLHGLRDTGWIFFVCLLLFFCIFIFPIISDDPSGSLKLLLHGEIRELFKLIGNNFLYFVINLILTVLGLATIWILLNVVSWIDKRLIVTKNIIIRILYWALAIVVLLSLLLLYLAFMKDLVI